MAAIKLNPEHINGATYAQYFIVLLSFAATWRLYRELNFRNEGKFNHAEILYFRLSYKNFPSV